MDDIFDSLSKKGRKLKDRLRGKKREPDRTGANTPGDIAGSSGSLLRPEPRTVAGGHDREGKRTSTGVQQDHSRDPSPQPEPTPADGGDDARQRGEADVDEKEVSQNHLRLDPDVEVVVDSGASREVERVYPSPSTGEPDSTRTFSFQLLYLIVLSDNAGTSAVPDRASEDVLSTKDAEPNAAVNENKRDWKSTAYETAKLLLRGVNESADVFAPLKSVTAGLCFILDNCEVWSSPAYAITALTGVPANEGK